MVVSKEQVREIDISAPARALGFLRLTDYSAIFCISWLLNLLALPFINPAMRQAEELVFNLVAVALLLFMLYTVWRHVGVIDARVWRSHMIAFPLLLLFCVFVFASTLVTSSTNYGGINLEDFQTVNHFSVSWLLAGAAVGFVSVLLLKRMRPATFGIPLVELLRELSRYEDQRAVDAKKIKRVNAPRGIVLGALGSVISVIALDPLAFLSMAVKLPIGLLGCFLLIRARRYFQVSADSLLSADKRKPVLFLRSFDDDEQVKFHSSGKAILDFSLETRLSNHFTYFGPFIAIGSPTEPVPQIGAARVILSDSEWQPRVLEWMSEARVIVMYSGKSQWVTWELAKLVNTERVGKLILIIPQVRGWRSATRSRDIAARIEHVREAFKNTKWRQALAALQNFGDIRALLFRSDGSLIVIKSGPRNRDSYHLAALIAHYTLLRQPAMLVGIGGAVQDRQYPLDTEIFHIGAAPDNNLIIQDDDYVSDRHACLCYEKGNLSIADQHSKNGTFVNGDRLRNGALSVTAGDQIRIGHSIFEIAPAEDRRRAAA